MSCTISDTFDILQTSANLAKDIMPTLITLVEAFALVDAKGNRLPSRARNTALGDVDGEWQTLKEDISNKCLTAFSDTTAYGYAYNGAQSVPLDVDPQYNSPRYITGLDSFLCFNAGDTTAVQNYITQVVGPAFPANYSSGIIAWLNLAIPKVIASGGEGFSKSQFSRVTPSISNPDANDGYKVDIMAIYNTYDVNVAGGGTQKKSFVQFCGAGYYIQPDPPSLYGRPNGRTVIRIASVIKDLALTYAVTNKIYTDQSVNNAPVYNVIVENTGTFSNPQISIVAAEVGQKKPSGGMITNGNALNGAKPYADVAFYQPILDVLSDAGLPSPVVVTSTATDQEMATFAYLDQLQLSAEQ